MSPPKSVSPAALTEESLGARSLNSSATPAAGTASHVFSKIGCERETVNTESVCGYHSLESKSGSVSEDGGRQTHCEEAMMQMHGEGKVRFEAIVSFDARPDGKGYASPKEHPKGHHKVHVGAIFVLIGEGDFKVYHVQIGCPFERNGETCVSGVNKVKQNRCGNEQLAKRREMEKVVEDFNSDGILGPVIAISSGGSEMEGNEEDAFDLASD